MYKKLKFISLMRKMVFECGRGGGSDVEWCFKGVVGRYGGLLIMWKKVLFELNFSFMGIGFLGVNVGWKWVNIYLENVYVGCNMQKKRRFWCDLMSCNERFSSGEWCVDGDFNAVTVAEERRGCLSSVNYRETEEFNSFINDMKVVDMGAVEKVFSSYSLYGRARSRINHFLLSEGLVDLWKVDNQVIGNRDLSYHCPMWFKGVVRD